MKNEIKIAIVFVKDFLQLIYYNKPLKKHHNIIMTTYDANLFLKLFTIFKFGFLDIDYTLL